MHSILWASLLASAGVALVTTLLIEYLAKPGLEARRRAYDTGGQNRPAPHRRMAAAAASLAWPGLAHWRAGFRSRASFSTALGAVVSKSSSLAHSGVTVMAVICS